MADIVLWRPAFFGIKPELVIKGGFIAWGAMGDSAASLMTCEPLRMRPQWGAFGRRQASAERLFRQSRCDRARHRRADWGCARWSLPTGGTRKLNKQHMLHNSVCPKIEVNAQTFDVTVDGVLATCDPAKELPLAQRYMLR